MQKVIQVIDSLTAEACTQPSDWVPPAKNDALVIALKKVIGGRLSDAFHIRDKLQRRDTDRCC